jgi:hypothetical protein
MMIKSVSISEGTQQQRKRLCRVRKDMEGMGEEYGRMEERR